MIWSRRASLLVPELAAEVASSPSWMYEWPLGDGIDVPLIHQELPDVHRTRAEMIAPVVQAALSEAGTNANAIDLGCSEGLFSQLLLEWGATSVLGVDVRDVNIRRAKLLANHFGVAPDRLSFVRSDVKELDPDSLGPFDVVLALGLVYHLEDPVGMLRLARRLTGSLCVVESQLTCQNSPIEYGWGATDAYLSTDASFGAVVETYDAEYPTASTAGVLSLIPNRAALELMMRVAGFDEVEWLEAGEDHNQQYRRGDRAIAVGRVSA